MRVLLLTNGVAPEQLGGLQRYVRELGAALVRSGLDVSVLTRRRNDGDPHRELAPDGIEILRFHTPSKASSLYAVGYPAATLRAVRRTVRAAGAECVLHSHFTLHGIALALDRRPFLHTFHAPVHREIASERQDSYWLPRGFERALVAAARQGERMMLSRATRIITLSHFMRREATSLCTGAARTTEVLPGGIDTNRFAPGDGITHPAAAGADPLLFCARRIVVRTGVVELVQAMPHVVRALPQARLIIAGTGALEETIRAEIRRLALADSVHVIGRISDEDLVRWYRSADLVVVPTQQLEGFGLTTAEALACGTPVLGTSAGATPELLAELDPRLVASDITPIAIAEGVISLASDRDRLRRIAARARARVHPDLSWPRIAQRHVEIYEALAAGAPSPRARPCR